MAHTGAYSGCQKNVPVFKRFFLQSYILLCRTSEFRNIIMENGIIWNGLRGDEAAAEMIPLAYGLEMGSGVQDFPDLARNLL